jgi:3-oxoacyl-[acyl-carrier-protein] synthase-3
MAATYAHITGWGIAVPEKVLSNDTLSSFIDTSDEWIRTRTGIQYRRIADKDQSTSSLASEAAVNALQVANLSPNEVDLIIVATSTPEYIFPSTACLVQEQIGANNAGAFDLLAACTGFIYALNMAAQAIRSGSTQSALVIGAETLSRIVDWDDRNTCVLFGDGAGAFVLQANQEPGGLLSAVMHSDGSGADLLSVPAGGSAMPASRQTVDQGLHFIKMNGKEVFRFATRVMTQATHEAIAKANLGIDDIHLIVPHQANIRILKSAARGLKLPMDRIVVNLKDFGNTSTASIPIAAFEAITDGRIKPGDNIVLVGFGAGLTWGAATIQWTGPHLVDKPIKFNWYRFLTRFRTYFKRLRRKLEGYIWRTKT